MSKKNKQQKAEPASTEAQAGATEEAAMPAEIADAPDGEGPAVVEDPEPAGKDELTEEDAIEGISEAVSTLPKDDPNVSEGEKRAASKEASDGLKFFENFDFKSVDVNNPDQVRRGFTAAVLKRWPKILKSHDNETMNALWLFFTESGELAKIAKGDWATAPFPEDILKAKGYIQ